MIERIEITGIATYGSVPAVLSELKAFNYFYGANGSGKTTISRVIADVAKFPSCTVGWKARSPLEPLVYNRDFVEKHFRESEELPGIFTLGEKNAEAAERIEVAKKEFDRLSQEISNLKMTLGGVDGNGGKIGEMAVAEDALKDACWKQKQLHDEKLKVAFEGVRSKSEAFKQRILTERTSNNAELKTLDYILEKAATVFTEGVAPISPLSMIETASLLDLEKSPILAKKIIGRSDVDIAAMIQRLGNSDWVRSGRAFLSMNNETCPFCQQIVSADLESKLAAYFDETFEKDSHEVNNLVSKYSDEAESISTAIEALLLSPPPQLNQLVLTETKKLFDAQIEINRQRLDGKKKEPSQVVILQSSQELIEEISTLIVDANKAIGDHNKTVTNLVKERKTLKDQVWKFLLEEPLKESIHAYESKTGQLEKAMTSIRQQIRDREKTKRSKEDEIRDLERAVTSIQPTIDAINGLLASFGFHGFTLAQADNKRCYKLRRSNGADAKETLSEGEKTFVTFLYFYHLLKGSQSEAGITKDRVVVFDDPVSSLDCDILFIVSTLVRKLCEDIRAGTTTVKQVFMLTHNVYFHKEVTFQKSRGISRQRDETFWTVRKANNESQITMHDSNPIKSSYELLWLDIRESRSDNRSIQNSLRRILETYFKMLGGIDLDKIHERFDGNEKLACRALLSWVNDGSHSAHDDLYVAVDDSTVTLYLDVFRKIFDGEGHIEHYNMMMASPVVTTSPI